MVSALGARPPPDANKQQVYKTNQVIQSRNDQARILYGVSAAAASAAVVMLLWPRITGAPAPVTVGFAPRPEGGIGFDHIHLLLTFAWRSLMFRLVLVSLAGSFALSVSACGRPHTSPHCGSNTFSARLPDAGDITGAVITTDDQTCGASVGGPSYVNVSRLSAGSCQVQVVLVDGETYTFTVAFPSGEWIDRAGMRRGGYCVCQLPDSAGNRSWSCADAWAWPCPDGRGC